MFDVVRIENRMLVSRTSHFFSQDKPQYGLLQCVTGVTAKICISLFIPRYKTAWHKYTVS